MKTETELSDGLYVVRVFNARATFIVEDGVVVSCAPAILAKLDYYMTIAEKVR